MADVFHFVPGYTHYIYASGREPLFFLLLGVANAGTSSDVRLPLLGNRLALGGGLAILAIALGGFALPWLSARLTSAGLHHPSSAAADFRWARRLDPLSVDPLVAEATVAATPLNVTVF